MTMRDLGKVVSEEIWGLTTWGDWGWQTDDSKAKYRNAAKAAIRELLDTAEGDDFTESVYWSQVPDVGSLGRNHIRLVLPKVLAELRKLADVAPEPTAPAETPAAEPAPAESADSRQLLLEHAKLTIQFLRSMATVTAPACMRVAMADRAQCLEDAVAGFDRGAKP